MTTSEPIGEDKVVYFGVININEKGRTVGAIDIWRNVITKELFCEEKRLGILEIADNIGMPKIDKDKKWAVAINRKKAGNDRWKLIKIIRQGNFKFTDTDDETTVEVDVKDYRIADPDWWNFLVENNINRSIEITEQKNAK
ncbi:MAG TPA: hypothetical protein VE573_03355 [Nitrososphaeraceae archaeon]|jgi:hypothetical protein|nr:hypothetical protein [Thermoproteota archaeon]MDQ4023450.1 hypothetical protein [Thermoproteota archaeon]HKG72365.1 hypothetical protein [Nitrososphaeraceae archaeon]HZA61887.1 hypothetical protein [Nitrososphaeraceae archaeon]